MKQIEIYVIDSIPLFADIMGLILAKKRNEEGRKKIGTIHKPLFGILSNNPAKY